MTLKLVSEITIICRFI